MICSAIGPELRQDLRQHVDVAPEGVQVLGLAETVVFQQPRVIGRVVGHHEGGGGVEAVDQQAHLVVQRRIGRPAKAVDALIGKPLPHGVQQAVGHLLIVDALEEAEETAALPVTLVVTPIQDGGDPAADLAAAKGQERLHPVPFVERVRPVSDQFLLVAAQRRNPVRVVAVQGPGKLQELSSFPPGGNPFDNQFRHGYSLWCGLGVLRRFRGRSPILPVLTSHGQPGPGMSPTRCLWRNPVLNSGIMTKVLVTGATGFIGSHLVKSLLAKREEVTCLVRKSSSVAALEAAGVRLVYGDVTDATVARGGRRRTRCGLSPGRLPADPAPKQFFRVNEEGVRNLAAGLRRAARPRRCW